MQMTRASGQGVYSEEDCYGGGGGGGGGGGVGGGGGGGWGGGCKGSLPLPSEGVDSESKVLFQLSKIAQFYGNPVLN